jgi:hypothetical protein
MPSIGKENIHHAQLCAWCGASLRVSKPRGVIERLRAVVAERDESGFKNWQLALIGAVSPPVSCAIYFLALPNVPDWLGWLLVIPAIPTGFVTIIIISGMVLWPMYIALGAVFWVLEKVIKEIDSRR